jgi:hypothetical protein
MISSLNGQSIYEVYPQIDIPSVAYKSNNKYANFPPIMNDGRAVMASWQPNAVVDEVIRKDNRITSNWQYRRYLTKNAEEIRSHNFKQACNDIGYYIRNENKDLDRSIAMNPPHTYKNVNEPIQHIGATTSDMKELYLTKEQLQSRQVVPSITQDELMRNWGQYMRQS